MARPSAEPVSRRERPAKAALTRAGIVAAAVEILQAEGLERVTMRRLAEKPDTGTGPDRLEWMLTAFINGILRTSR